VATSMCSSEMRGSLSCRPSRRLGPHAPPPLHPPRCTGRHDDRGRHRVGDGEGPPSDGVLWIATNLQDVPAEIIAEVYRQR
jgi:hypothetical protein